MLAASVPSIGNPNATTDMSIPSSKLFGLNEVSIFFWMHQSIKNRVNNISAINTAIIKPSDEFDINSIIVIIDDRDSSLCENEKNVIGILSCFDIKILFIIDRIDSNAAIMVIIVIAFGVNKLDSDMLPKNIPKINIIIDDIEIMIIDG